MTNQHLYFAVGVPCMAVFLNMLTTILAILWSVRGIDKWIDDTKDVLRAEIKAFRVEILGEIQALHVEIETQMKQHTAEYHQ